MQDFRVCLKGLHSMLRPIRRRVFLTGLLGVMLVGVSMTFVWISKRVVDVATGASDMPMGRAVGIMIAVMAVQVALRVAMNYWNGYVVVNAQNSTRARVFSSVMRSTWEGKERFHSADTVNRLEEDIRVCVDFLCNSLPSVVVTFVQLCAAAAFLFVLAPRLAWILIFIMPVAVVGSRLFFRKMRRLTNEIRAGDSRVQGHMQENLQHRVLVKTLGSTDSVLDTLDSLQKDVRDNTVKRLDYGAVSRTFMQVGFAAGYALAFLWGAYGLKNGTVTYGLMVAFLQLVGQIQRPVAELAGQIPAFIRALSSEDRLLEITSQPSEDEAPDFLFSNVPGIRVEDLSYSYPDQQKTVLEHLSFDFKPGSITAIVGPTGAGKSTLVRIILSLMKPSGGRVILYNEACERPSGVDTRCNFMYVPQGNSLMSGTIRDNMRMALPDATDEQISAVLHLAAADFVFDLPEGLDTVCAEVGSGLSEGQAQRIAVARALLRPGGVLVLDEATSALDADTELKLLERLSEAYRGSKTILCITHRPAATSFADAVLELK